MKRFKLSEAGSRGWFIGDFDQAVFRTKDFEVNHQVNEKGWEKTHIHKIISEITLVIEGRMVVNGQLFEAGDIYILEAGDISQMEYLERTSTVTVKVPSVPSDKYLL